MRYVLISLMLLVSSVFAQTAGEAEMAFNREYNEAKAVFDARVKAAQDKFVAVLKEELKRLTQKGDLDGAITVREKIKSLEDETKPNDEVVKVDGTKFQSLIGNYKGNVLEYKISRENGVYILEELSPHQFKSISSIIFKNMLLFQWPNNEDSISVEVNQNGVLFTCWKHGSRGGLVAKQPSGDFWWKSILKKIN